MRTKRVQAFSLVEMIVVMVVATTIALAIYTAFSQGLRLWQRGSSDRGQWKIDLFFEKMTGQIRNALEDSRWRMSGSRTTLDFSTVTSEKAMAQPVYLRYAYDATRQLLASGRFSLADLSDEKLAQRPLATVLDKVSDFTIEYYAFDARAKEYRWFQKWQGNCLPETVKIAMQLHGSSNERVIRMINVPAGKVCVE